jgi:dihydroflavonol-4-reductase
MNTSKIAFVTGATGLLGNHVVRQLLAQGHGVRALIRSPEKARRQLGDLLGQGLQLVEGDIRRPADFAQALRGVDVLFHTAAYFRESYEGGAHAAQLHETNVEGTEQLMRQAYAAGVRCMVHVSSIAVLGHNPGGEVDESLLQVLDEAKDDYYRSKIQTDERVYRFLAEHPDMHISLVLPGWMHGPGDAGPTAAGRFVLDYLQGKLPAFPDATFSLVDARDVAAAALAAADNGRRGERYLAAGRAMHMRELMAMMEVVTGQAGPRRQAPTWLMFVLAMGYELHARLTGKPALLSLASARTLVNDYGRRFSSEKTRRELGVVFRPVDQTLRDAVAWYRGRAGFLA